LLPHQKSIGHYASRREKQADRHIRDNFIHPGQTIKIGKDGAERIKQQAHAGPNQQGQAKYAVAICWGERVDVDHRRAKAHFRDELKKRKKHHDGRHRAKQLGCEQARQPDG